MGLNCRNYSFDDVKLLTCPSPMKVKIKEKKKKHLSSHGDNEVPISTNPRMDSLTDEEEEEIDLFDKQLGKERCVDDRESMWLSSDSVSPSSFFEEYMLPTPCRDSNDNRLASSDVATTIPNAEENVQKIFKENGRDLPDSIMCSPEKAKSSSNPLNINVESRSQIWELDRTSFWVSLVNLEGEDSEWNSSETELGLDYFQSDFPSPSYSRRSSRVSDIPLSNSSDSTPTKMKDAKSQCDLSLELASELQDFNGNEPLFWPFERKFDWNSEDTCKYFSMSPRKNIVNIQNPRKTSPESIRMKIHGRRSADESGYNNNNSNLQTAVDKIKSTPSRLRRSTKIVPLEITAEIARAEDKDVSRPEIVCVDTSLLEDDFLTNEELSIEKVLGLGEFDGHEGIDSEFNNDVFFLDDCL